jgi:hypothetical protein
MSGPESDPVAQVRESQGGWRLKTHRIMEWWKIGISGIKTDDIRKSKISFHFGKPGYPGFHYSNIPCLRHLSGCIRGAFAGPVIFTFLIGV